MKNDKSRNSIFEINHTVNKPAVMMNRIELSDLKSSNYSNLQKNCLEKSSGNQALFNDSLDFVDSVGLESILVIETEKNCIGIGQYSSVYLGTATFSLPELPLQLPSKVLKNVAVKIGKGGLQSQIKIKLEAQILSQQRHENIIRFVHESEQGNVPILVLEYLSFGNLYEWVIQKEYKKVLNQKLWLKWAKQIDRALDYVHHFGIIHNDVKPQNIMLTKGLDLKLCDFGNSCFVPEANQKLFENCQDVEKYDLFSVFKVSSPLVRVEPGSPSFKDSQTLYDGAGRGTLAYTAPEMILNESYSFQSDIYSFGIVLFFLISGLEPFARSKSNIYIIIGIKKGFFDSGMQGDWDGRYLSGEQVLPEINHLLQKMLDLNPVNRPFAHQIIEILDSQA